MQNINISINLDKKGILFSYQGKCILKNYIMVVANHYIYKNKFSAKQLNINSFIYMLKVKFQCERYIANINIKWLNFLKNGLHSTVILTIIKTIIIIIMIIRIMGKRKKCTYSNAYAYSVR